MSLPSGYSQYQLPQFTPQQMQLYNQMIGSLGGLGGGMDYLNRLASGDEELFKQIEAPAYQALQQQQAQTAGRFSGVGGQDSSAFANALAGQSGQMAQNLASQRSQMQQGAIDKLMGFSERMLQQRPYETGLQQEGGLDIQGLIETFGPMALDLLMGNYGGAASKGMGAKSGDDILSTFQKWNQSIGGALR